MGVRVPSKRFPSSPLKNALCHPPGPQVMQYVFSCFFPGFGGHRCRTYTPVFYKGVFLIWSPVFFALGAHHSLEKNGFKKDLDTPHSIEVSLWGGPVPQGFISIEWVGPRAPPEFAGGYFRSIRSINPSMHPFYPVGLILPRSCFPYNGMVIASTPLRGASIRPWWGYDEMAICH